MPSPIPFTLQQTLDTVVAHLRSGGVRSRDSDSELCVYRGPNGSKCFIGLMLADDEAGAVGDLCATDAFYTLGWEPVRPDHEYAFASLQTAHDEEHHWNSDGSGFSEAGWRALREWAETYNLTWPEEA